MDTRNLKEQFKRGVRAMMELERFLFIVDGRTTYVHSDNSNETYTMTHHTCTCGDWQHRGSKHGFRCKHLIARGLRSARVEVVHAA